MDLRYTGNTRLPKLSWLAKVDRAGGIVRVQHGSSIEVWDKFFIEGTWNGPFERGDFAHSDCVFGTGGVLCGDAIVFVTSADTTDYVYYRQTRDGVSVSNSLPLLLASLKDCLDPSFTGYDRINDSITDGIDRYVRDIPTLQGAVRRLMYRNLYVSAGSIKEVDKDMPPRFGCYAEYHSYLVENYQRIVENIRDSCRKTRLEICSTQSKGYDTTAVNSIAQKFGIDKVFTVMKGKHPAHFATNDQQVQADDDGTEICHALGLSCIPLDRRAFAKGFEKEYLFYAALHQNQDANLMEMEKHMTGVSILLTGHLGEIWHTDKYYRQRPGYINSELKRGDLAGHGLSELRLVVGFIQLPLIYIGARRREDIFRITESSEMVPWRLDTFYDRPIARRLAEEAGVPRNSFGQVKVASVVLFPKPCIPYGEELRHEFLEFLVHEKLLARWTTRLWSLVHFVNTVLAFRTSRYKIVYFLERVISKVMGHTFEFTPLWQHRNGLVFCFCVNKCAREYETYLQHE
jgi:hypothetical protein